jgi:hypothetical protein
MDLEAAAGSLAETFTHLGRTSALFFLFSAGWRPQEVGPQGAGPQEADLQVAAEV